MDCRNRRVTINSIALDMSIPEACQILGKPTGDFTISEGLKVLDFQTTESDLDLVTVRFSKEGRAFHISGWRLEVNGNRISPIETDHSPMNSRVCELLRERLGVPDKILETHELGEEYWLYPSDLLQISLCPGKAPWYALVQDFTVPDFSIEEFQLEEYEYNLKAGVEVDWQPNPRAKVVSEQ